METAELPVLRQILPLLWNGVILEIRSCELLLFQCHTDVGPSHFARGQDDLSFKLQWEIPEGVSGQELVSEVAQVFAIN